MPVLKALVGGQWVEVSGGSGGGTGSDEVFIQADDPITLNPLAELWYDTDAVTPTSNPVAEIFYSEITALVTITATSAATAQTVVNPGNVTYDGTPILLEFFSGQTIVAPGAQLIVNLWDGNTDLGFWGQVIHPGGAGALCGPMSLKRRITPTAGTHNYNVRTWVTAGTGNTISGQSPHQPTFLRATRVLQGGGTIAPPQSGLDINRPAAAAKYAGLRYYATDTLRDWLCDGTGWIIVSEPAQTNFTPSVYPSGGAFTLGAVSFTYNRSDGFLDWTCDIRITNVGNGTGVVVMSVPVACAVDCMIGTVREDNTTGFLGGVRGFTNGVTYLCRYDNGFLGGTGYRLVGGGRYRMISRYY